MSEEIYVEIICNNLECWDYGEVVNTVTGFANLEELDLFLESFGDGDDSHDICKSCGELGIAEAYGD